MLRGLGLHLSLGFLAAWALPLPNCLGLKGLGWNAEGGLLAARGGVALRTSLLGLTKEKQGHPFA